MFAALLISLREVIEALLIVVTLWGITTKVNLGHLRKHLAAGALSATIVSLLVVILGSIIGIHLETLYEGSTEQIVEAILMLSSAGFITWAVIYLHQSFAPHKLKFLHNLSTSASQLQGRNMFILGFISVLREGVELAIFIQSLYFSSSIWSVYLGVLSGGIIAILLGWAIIKSVVKLPIYVIFQVTTALLILFAAGLLVRGIHELAEIGVIAEYGSRVLPLLPEAESSLGTAIKMTLGLTSEMDFLQISVYSLYVTLMTWFFLLIPATKSKTQLIKS